jgi:hypothetical protein
MCRSCGDHERDLAGRTENSHCVPHIPLFIPLFIRAWPVALGGLARVCEVARVGCVTLDDGSQRTSSVENGLWCVDLWLVLRTPRGGVVSLPYVYGTVLVAMFGSRLDRRCLPEELATARRPKTVVKNTRYSSHGSEA